MNIAEAKKQIEYAMRAYFAKDEHGSYILPTPKQRPVFLLGAPGIGKTAIMEQIAQDLEVGFVSYSMTHHTRQSALGLPFIAHKTYGGTEYDVSEYTMSEIIAAVYDNMEITGKSEGILFLDEINCVSETLTPAMLQFLQYKVFGRHKVPEGWIVVTAGNPPEYNRTVHEFDIATLDRLKKIEVEPDFQAWRDYAVSTGVHPAVISYLDIQQGHFYHMEATIDGTSFVTARSWDDLSSMIKLYEAQNLPVDALLIGQYVQDEEIARRFGAYFDLFTKYRSDYQVDSILDQSYDPGILARAQAASFDERIALVGMLSDALNTKARSTVLEEQAIAYVHASLAQLKESLGDSAETADVSAWLTDEQGHIGKALEAEKAAGLLSDEKRACYRKALGLYGRVLAGANPTFGELASQFAAQVDDLDDGIATTSDQMTNAFAFANEAFGEGQEMLLLVTDLSASKYTMAHISAHGCAAFDEHAGALHFQDRAESLLSRIGTLDLDEQA